MFAFVCRFGLAGDPQNLGKIFSGNTGIQELAGVCGAVLRSQHLVGTHFQAVHA